ncbi:Imm27 family immunity protein [Terriglobus tenax]|uniref:Imm27 family immunity protein n=1 Tax=Terriglobus tenax TaxID=1111115 RepID=UPI0037DA4EEC
MNLDGLEKIATTDGGWTTLYRSKVDGLLLQRSFPNSEMHGGGPALWQYLTEEEAKQRFDI